MEKNHVFAKRKHSLEFRLQNALKRYFTVPIRLRFAVPALSTKAVYLDLLL